MTATVPQTIDNGKLELGHTFILEDEGGLILLVLTPPHLCGSHPNGIFACSMCKCEESYGGFICFRAVSVDGDTAGVCHLEIDGKVALT